MDNPSPPKQPVKWYYEWWFVLAMLFLILGPFGLPLVYKSPRFNRPAKIILTILMIAFTISLSLGLIEMINLLVRELQSIQQL